MAHYRLGKLPARKDAVKLKLVDYLDLSKLPQIPNSFGHEKLVLDKWQMLGNDLYGDCVWAGAAHETMIWNREANKTVTFNQKTVLSDYSAVTGFQINDPSTDQGTDMQQAASYRFKTGVLDAKLTRHKVGAYVAITPGNIQEHLAAAYLFGVVGIGIKFPTYAMDQFNQGKKWTYHFFHSIEGGHYVPLVARRNNNFYCVTWGSIQAMTDSFFKHFNDESIAYCSEEMLTNGKSLEGFDINHLKADLQLLK